MRCLKFFDWVACSADMPCQSNLCARPSEICDLRHRGLKLTAQFDLKHEFTEQFLDLVDDLHQYLAGNCGDDIAFHCTRCMKYHIPPGVDMQIISASMKKNDYVLGSGGVPSQTHVIK